MSNAKSDPGTGSYGIFGTAEGSKIGTIRRVGKASNVRTKWLSEGTGADARDPHGWTDTGNWEDRWRDPYMRDIKADVSEIGEDLRPATDEELAAGLPSMVFSDSDELDMINAAQTRYALAEGAYETAEAAYEVAEDEYEEGKIQAQEDYETTMEQVQQEQKAHLEKRYAKTPGSEIAEGRAGFAYSGPVARLREYEGEKSKKTLADMMAAKTGAKETREQTLYDVEQAWSGPEGAQSDWETAQTTHELAGIDFDLEMKDIFRTALTAIEGLEIGLENLALKDENVEGAYLTSSSGGYSNLWSNLRGTSEWTGKETQIKGAETGYQSLLDNYVRPDVS